MVRVLSVSHCLHRAQPEEARRVEENVFFPDKSLLPLYSGVIWTQYLRSLNLTFLYSEVCDADLSG